MTLCATSSATSGQATGKNFVAGSDSSVFWAHCQADDLYVSALRNVVLEDGPEDD